MVFDTRPCDMASVNREALRIVDGLRYEGQPPEDLHHLGVGLHLDVAQQPAGPRLENLILQHFVIDVDIDSGLNEGERVRPGIVQPLGEVDPDHEGEQSGQDRQPQRRTCRRLEEGSQAP